MDIRATARGLRAGTLTCERLARTCLDGVRSLEPRLNAFITITHEQATIAAKRLDQELRAGRDRGVLHGIPIVYKDCIDTANVRTTIGSHIFRDRVPDRDAEVVRRLSLAGAVMLGKSNMNELAAGGPGGYNKFYGATHNPWNLDHESGGSSSGTGAAVCAGLCFGGIGTDAGGSIRGPAAHMGIVGLRPTVGRTSLSGIFPRAPSFDTCGPLAPSVPNAAALFNALVNGSQDAPSLDSAAASLRGFSLGVAEAYCLRAVQEDVARAFLGALRTFEKLGARLVSLDVPELDAEETLAEATQLLVYEFACAFGDTYRSHRKDAFGPVVQSDFAKAQRLSESSYRAGLQFKRTFSHRIHALLSSIDALVTPTMATTAPPASQPDLTGSHRRFTIPFSLAGVPAVSIPSGVSSRGLPIGLQVVGAPFRENRLLEIAYAYEKATAPSRVRPCVYFDAMSVT